MCVPAHWRCADRGAAREAMERPSLPSRVASLAFAGSERRALATGEGRAARARSMYSSPYRGELSQPHRADFVMGYSMSDIDRSVSWRLCVLAGVE